MDTPERFRIFFWQKFTVFAFLPVFAGMLWISPVSDGWGATGWAVAGAIAAAAVVAYLGNAWLKSAVRLDDSGLTLHAGRWQTWPYEKLLRVRQIGRYRVRMCFDSGIAGTHMHVSVDLLDSDAFVDALLDRYAESQGHELPEKPDEDAGAAA